MYFSITMTLTLLILILFEFHSVNFLHCALRDLYTESVFEIFLRNLTSKSYASRPVILFHYFFLFLYTCFKNRNGQILSFLPEIARLLDHGKNFTILRLSFVISRRKPRVDTLSVDTLF